MDLKQPYYLKGNNVGCLLVHGFTSTPAEMYPVAEILANEGYTVYSVLLRGHGTHYDDLLDISYTDWYDSVKVGYANLSKYCDKIVVIGHSMGGLLSLKLAANYKVNKLICLAAALKPSSNLVPYTGILKYFKKYTSWGESSPLKNSKYMLHYNIFPVHSVHQLHLLSKDAEKVIKNIDSDCLIIHSEDDKSVRKQSATTIYNNIGSGSKELFWLQNATHSLTVGPEKDRVLDKIVEFIKDI